MNKSEDTLEKTYGNIPKEVGLSIDLFSFITPRPVKYIWLKWVVRKLFR